MYVPSITVEIIHIVSIMCASRREFLELLDQWNSYMRLKQFPMTLQYRMRYFFRKKFGKFWFNEAEILDGISGKRNRTLVNALAYKMQIFLYGICTIKVRWAYIQRLHRVPR